MQGEKERIPQTDKVQNKEQKKNEKKFLKKECRERKLLKIKKEPE